MRRQMVIGLFAVVLLVGSRAAADVVITLEPKDGAANPITGSVDAGTTVFVDILLSADGDDAPLVDLRMIQFDFGGTTPTIERDAFTWILDPGVSDISYLQFSALPAPTAAYTGLEGAEGLILNLDETPIRVAMIEMTVTGDGTLDAGASEGGGALVSADFTVPKSFSYAEGNLSAGTLTFTVSGTTDPGGDGDGDGDGVPDDEDAFPEDPDESVDTDADGVGDNADPDDDGDGVTDEEDAFPLDADESADTDGDSVGDNADPDDDADGVDDVEDDLPLNPNETVDTDGDGIGDNTDIDDDGDGVFDEDDSDPLDPDQTDPVDGSVDGDGTDPDEVDTTTGPPATGGFCGLGMLGSSVFILLGLSIMSFGRRGRGHPGKHRVS